jgi:hypothetical protein
MIEINSCNYEKYVVDFLEGNLDSSEKEAFSLFLKSNPEIREELDFFDDEKLIPEPVLFDNKGILKKESIITKSAMSNFDELCIAKMEGDLSEKEISLFDELINSDKSKQTEFERFQKTIIKPDDTIVFREKEKLKKRRVGIWRSSYSVISIAASILIIIGLFTLLPKPKEETKQLADGSNTISSVEEKGQQEQKETIAKHQEIEEQIDLKTEILPKIKINTQNTLAKVQIEIGDNTKELDKIIITNPFEKLQAKVVVVESDYTNSIMLKEMTIINTDNYKLKQADYLSVRSFVAKTINKKIFHRDKTKLEVFDIAQAGVQGLNKLTGGNMKLERVYDVNGKLDKTEFTSKLLAFSTPSKK